MFIHHCYFFSNFDFIFKITIYFNFAILSYSVCILRASEWIISRSIVLYKCTYYYNKFNYTCTGNGVIVIEFKILHS